MNIGTTAAVFLLAGGAVFSGPGTLPAQERNQIVPRHDAAAIVKLVAVRVLDGEGRPVMGLAKEDFVLRDNGQEMTITEFEVHRLAGEEAAGEPAERPAAAPGPASRLNRKLFIFLDLQGSDEDGMSNAKKAVFHFLDTQLRPDDEVGIIGFSPMRGFFVQEYLTTDHNKIRKAVAKTKEIPPSAGTIEKFGPDDQARPVRAEGGGENVGVREAGSLARRTDASASASAGRSSVFVPGTSAFQRGDFVPRLADLAEVMKHIPGNKSLVFFSGRNLGRTAKALGRAFADAGTPIYAVNTKNWIMKGVLSRVKEKHIYEEHSLKDLSLASGGEYFADIEDIRTIARDVQALTGNYYVLGYYVKESWDGKFHEIKVEAERPGLQVVAQEGYFNPKPFAEMTEFEKDLNLFGLIYSEGPALGDAPEFPISFLDVDRPGGRDGVVLIELAVDPKMGVSPSTVELFALIRDEDLEPVVSRKWDVDLSTYDGKTVVFCLYAPFGPGEYDGRVVVRDAVTGRSAVGRTAFEVGPRPEGDIVLSSPVILLPGAEARIANLPSGRKARGGTAERTLVDLYPFISRDCRIVVRNVDFGTERIRAVVPVRFKAADPKNPPRIGITGRIVPEAGGEGIPLDLEVVEAKAAGDGREFLIVEIALPALERGEYTLEITAEDIDTEKSASVKTPIAIR